jgi:hypothetical protein
MLSRVLPKVDAGNPLLVACRTAAILSTAWLLTSPWTWSWYDIIAWATLAVLAMSKLDWILLWRGLWLSLAFVTGRWVDFSEEMSTCIYYLRDVICPMAQFAALGAVIILFAQRSRPCWALLSDRP